MPKRNAKLLQATDSDGSDEEAAGSDEERIVCGACGREVDGDASVCAKCGADIDRGGCGSCAVRSCTCCVATICVIVGGLLLLGVLAVIFCNIWVKASIELVGTAALGAKVTVESVDIGIPYNIGHISISELRVASPHGFDDPPLFILGSLAFDISPWSVLPLINGNQQEGGPLIIDQLTIQTVNVSIYQPNLTTSNAQVVSKHVASEAKALAPVLKKAGMPDLKHLTPEQKQMLTHGVIQTLLTKVIVGKIQFTDLGITYCFQPICETLGVGPAEFKLDEVRLDGVGQQRNGVYVIELIADLVTALLMAIIKVSHGKSRLTLLKSLHPLKELQGDCNSVVYSAGSGLVEIAGWSGWATAELAALPLRVAAMDAKLGLEGAEINAKLGLKGAELGAETNYEMAKLGLKGAEFGAKTNYEMAKMGVKANVGIAKMGVKANVGAAKFGAHMLGMGAKLTSAFVGGAAKVASHGALPPPPPYVPPPPPPPVR